MLLEPCEDHKPSAFRQRPLGFVKSACYNGCTEGDGDVYYCRNRGAFDIRLAGLLYWPKRMELVEAGAVHGAQMGIHSRADRGIDIVYIRTVFR